MARRSTSSSVSCARWLQCCWSPSCQVIELCPKLHSHLRNQRSFITSFSEFAGIPKLHASIKKRWSQRNIIGTQACTGDTHDLSPISQTTNNQANLQQPSVMDIRKHNLINDTPAVSKPLFTPNQGLRASPRLTKSSHTYLCEHTCFVSTRSGRGTKTQHCLVRSLHTHYLKYDRHNSLSLLLCS